MAVTRAFSATPVEPIYTPTRTTANSGTESLPPTLPDGAYQTPPAAGVPYSRIFRNSGAPFTNPLNPIRVTPTVRTESVQAQTTLSLPISASFPLLQRGFEPQDADLKFGPVFFKLQGISAGILASDNINQTERHRESGTIAIVSISGAIIAQLTAGLRIAVSGSFVYLPLQNEAGIAGFGLYAPFIFGFDNQPIFRSEVTWNTIIGGWNVVFADDFVIGVGTYSNNIRNDAAYFEGGGFDGYDQAGRYVFRAQQGSISRDDDFRHDESNNDFIYFSNTISAQADRLIVGKTRLRVQASHENLWYNQGNRGLPKLRDQVNVSLVSEKENLRFKPFLIYQASKTDRRDDFLQSVRFGLDGPITDQLHFHAEFGGYFSSNDNGLLWLASLVHQAGPYTEESLVYSRSLTTFQDQVSEGITYRIRQIIGPKVIADAFISRHTVDGLDDDGFSYDELRTGVRFAIRAGPRTTVNLTGTYAMLDSSNRSSETWTGLVEIDRYFTETFRGRLIYQYQKNDSAFFNDSYYENLIYLTLTKYFN